MSDLYAKYIGKWINLKCKTSTCMGKIESINEDKIILSNAILSNSKLCTRFTGIDINLILAMDFVQPPNHTKINEDFVTPMKQELLNVYTSDTQPPSIRRGGSSSAVNRNLMRQSISQEKFPTLKNNSSFTNYSSNNRKLSGENQILNEPAWMNFSPDEIDTEFDFDKNLALFDKDSFGQSKKCSNENSDSSDSTGQHGHKFPHKLRSHTISFDPDDFSSIERKPRPTSEYHQSNSGNDGNGIKRDILSEFKHIGIIPTTAMDSCVTTEAPPNEAPIDDNNLSFKLFQQPDLVREITQSQLKNNVLRSSTPSAISINRNSDEFPAFTEFWNVDNECVFPVFTTRQRDLLLETASQLGFESSTICDNVGETISDFVITQVGGRSRINEANLNRVPKIVILMGRCNASMYAASVAKCLLKKGCHILVFVDDNKLSDINYKIDYEIMMLNNILSKNGPTQGYNFITYNVQDLVNKNVDFIISGVESDSSANDPSSFLQFWCSNKTSQLLCINPPHVSCLPWKVAVFTGVPTAAHGGLDIKMLYRHSRGGRLPVANANGSEQNQTAAAKHQLDGLILLCNLHLPEKVFTFLNLSYRSPFPMQRNWVRLYRDNDLCLVE